MLCGDYGSHPGEETAFALRFALPGDFDSGDTLNEAILNLRSFVDPGFGGSVRAKVSVLAATPQTLPSTESTILSAAGGSSFKSIGNVSSGDPVDYVIPENTYTAIAVDITAAVAEAMSAARLSDGYIVILVQAISYSSYRCVIADGIGQTSPPTLYLDYASASPPPDPLVAQPENSQTRSHGNQPQVIPHWTATPANSQAQSQGSEPQPIVVGVPANAQSRSQGSEPQVIPHWTATPENSQTWSQADEPQPFTTNFVAQPANSRSRSQGSQPQAIPNWTATPENSQTRSQADEPQADKSYIAQPANSQTRSQADEPQLTTITPRRRRSRALFPHALFPSDLLSHR